MPKPRLKPDIDVKANADTIMSFGKYCGSRLRDVPADYVEWLIDGKESEIAFYKGELKRREEEEALRLLAEEANTPLVERMANEGFRQLARTFHPDAGGTTEQFQQLQAAKEKLKQIFELAKSVGAL